MSDKTKLLDVLNDRLSGLKNYTGEWKDADDVDLEGAISLLNKIYDRHMLLKDDVKVGKPLNLKK